VDVKPQGMDTMKWMIALWLLVATAALAEDWVPMTGSEIEAVLTDREVIYEGAKQRFYASGRTLYNAGRESWGYWAARGDQYCSQWPPGDQWDCYDMAAKDGWVRFIGSDGSVTDGQIAAP